MVKDQGVERSTCTRLADRDSRQRHDKGVGDRGREALVLPLSLELGILGMHLTSPLPPEV